MDSGRMGRYEASALGKAPLQNIITSHDIAGENMNSN